MSAESDFILGEWKISPSRNRIVHRFGGEFHVEPKPMQVLLRLAAARGEVVTREAILEAVWPEEFVTEDVLSRCISVLRKALRDDSRTPRYIETIRKRGYRLVPPVESSTEAWGGRGRPEAGVRSPLHRIPTAQLWISMPAMLLLALLLGWAARATAPERPMERTVHPRLTPLTSFRGSELDPVLSPDGTRLAFSWSGDADDNFDVYVKGLGSEQVVRITSHPGEDKNPAWSPDGTRIVFVRSAPGASGIYLVPAGGGSEQKLAGTVSGDIPDLVWSTDGTSLYFPDRLMPGAPSGIFRLDLASLRKERITDPGLGLHGDRDLALSRDGKRIAFARAVTPDLEQLWIADADGASVRVLAGMNRSINGIEWTPDGESILFSSPQDGISRLWAIHRDGSGLRALVEMGDGVFDPSISRDGTTVVFERKAYDTNVWRLDPKGEPDDPVIVIDSTRWDSMAAISPDGSRVAFISDRGGPVAVWTSDRDGSGVVRLTDGSLRVSSGPQWSADGSSIVLALRQDGFSRLFRIDANGGPLERLTADRADDIEPVFSADGRSILFSSNRTGRWEIFRMDLDRHGPPVQLSRAGGLRCRESVDGREVFFSRPDGSGIWSIPDDGGDERLVLSSGTWSSPLEWDVGQSGIYFVTGSDNAAGPRKIVRFEFETRRIEPLSPPLRGLNIPNLGMSVARDENRLLFGRADRADGDIVLARGWN